MNERIWELAEQAITDDLPEPIAIPAEFVVRLAELIVGECANVLQKEIKTAIAHDGKETHIDLILIEHFGVEE